jgi:hypothetical protein
MQHLPSRARADERQTKPQLAGGLLQHAHDQGIRAAFIAGDEVYGALTCARASVSAAQAMSWRSAPATG